MARSPSQKLLRRHSSWRLLAKIVFLLAFVLVALAARIWVIEGVRIPDQSMAPQWKQGSWAWICKLQSCIDRATDGTPVLVKTPTGNRLLRVIAAGPGETLQGSPGGEIRSPDFHYMLREDPWFLDTAYIRVPKARDSITFATLNGAEMDLYMRLLKQQNPGKTLRVKASLWIDGHPSDLEKAKVAQIHGLSVKPSELGNFTWQELLLVQIQVLRMEHGASKVELMREPWLDSTQVKGLRIHENAFFAVCLRGRSCVDSRELGFIPRSRVMGTMVVLPKLAQIPFLNRFAKK